MEQFLNCLLFAPKGVELSLLLTENTLYQQSTVTPDKPYSWRDIPSCISYGFPLKIPNVQEEHYWLLLAFNFNIMMLFLMINIKCGSWKWNSDLVILQVWKLFGFGTVVNLKYTSRLGLSSLALTNMITNMMQVNSSKVQGLNSSLTTHACLNSFHDLVHWSSKTWTQ